MPGYSPMPPSGKKTGSGKRVSMKFGPERSRPASKAGLRKTKPGMGNYQGGSPKPGEYQAGSKKFGGAVNEMARNQEARTGPRMSKKPPPQVGAPAMRRRGPNKKKRGM